MRCIYIDEFMTTAATIQTHEWSLPKNYPVVDRKDYHRKTLASIVAISREAGTELITTFEKSVNQDKYIQFLKRLRQKH